MSKTNSSKHKWWALVATSSSLAMIFLDQSALPVALPTIQRELGLSPILLQWTINAYLLMLAVFIMLGGKLGDKLGHRKIFQSGMVLFIAASILCAMSPSGMWLVMSRALQGLGGALMIPASSPLFRTIVGPNEFGKMIGLYVSVASIFLILGPSLGGFLTDYLSWRWIFWINFPVALVSIFITIFMIPADVKHPLREQGFDWRGFISLSIFVICLVVAFMQGEGWGWTSPIILGCFLISLIAVCVFIATERKHPTPFVDFTLFKDICISRGILIITLVQVAYMSTIFWAIVLQYTLLSSPSLTGIYLLISQVPVLFLATVAGKILDRSGPRVPVCCGTLMLTISCLWMAIFVWQHHFIWLFPALLLFGMGSPFVSIVVMSSVVSSAPAEKRGIVSGTASAARQIGGSISLAILVALVVELTHFSMQHWLNKQSGVLANLHLDQLNALLTGIPLPANMHLNATEITVAHNAAINAYTLGFSCMMFVVSLFCFAAFWVARGLPNNPVQPK